jgi:sugar O-acyltransferase (sialic acid O-acetyltransferase NeuD family)
MTRDLVIVGAKGFAKEVLEILYQMEFKEKIFFFDDVTPDLPNDLFGYPIFKGIDEVKKYFSDESFDFSIGIGNPHLRKKIFEKFSSIGGKFESTISPFAQIGHFDNFIGEGCNVMTGTVITNSIKLGKGCLINLNCTIGHDSVLGDFVELSPGTHVSGNCEIGELTQIGTNVTILPKIKVGKNAIIGAGSVITKDIPDNVLVVGVPGKIIKTFDSEF